MSSSDNNSNDQVLADSPEKTGSLSIQSNRSVKPKSKILSNRSKYKKSVAAKISTTAKRQLSSIAFPYTDLDSVIALARAINDTGGLALTRDQLAGALRQSPTSGSFILKTSAARQFGLLEATQTNKFQLTQLGFTIIAKDEVQEKSARAAAFLNVPLYKKAYEEFKGRSLPPRPLGLESAFVQFGVSSKQKNTARQIFEKSARQAGFFNVDPDRLIEPVTVNHTSTTEHTDRESYSAIQPSLTFIQPDYIKKLDPLIQGLVDRLPQPGTTWEIEKRARWLQTLAANLDIVYDMESESIIIVETKKIISD